VESSCYGFGDARHDGTCFGDIDMVRYRYSRRINNGDAAGTHRVINGRVFDMGRVRAMNFVVTAERPLDTQD